MRVVESITELIGKTPVVRLKKLGMPGGASILLKLEYFNPGASIKDRTALGMIEQVEIDGRLKPGSVIVEPTSGNTGIGLAMIAAARGYKMMVIMPDNMSPERKKLMEAFGAEVILTPAAQGMQGAIDLAHHLATEEGYYLPQQFENCANPLMHQKTTAQEIIAQTQGKLDVFVAAVGTGGTLSGTGQGLKDAISGLKVVGVEPASSPVLSGGKPGIHKIQGIGAGFVPKILNLDIIDEIICVTDDDAIETTRRLAREEGILAGISTGAAVWAAVQIAQDLSQDKVVLTIAPDTGERYLSSGLY
ncbi:MAG: cysteine synthase A [Bacillota bacterium]|jgi:cysteine synthase A|nr:cysteine synthase A [Clostridia bacterium]